MFNKVLHAMPPTADWVNNLKKTNRVNHGLGKHNKSHDGYRDMPPVRTTTAIVDKLGPHTCITK